MEAVKLKIAFLSVFHPFRGGIAQFNTELFKALELTSEIKAFNFTTQYPAFLFPGKSQYVDATDIAPNFKAPRFLSSINPLSFSKTSKEINSFNPDVLISSYWMPFFGPSLGMVCKKVNKKTLIISIVHNAIPHEKRWSDKLFSSFYFKQQQGFVTMSKTVENDLKSLIPDALTMLRPHPLYAQFGERKDKLKTRSKLRVKKEQKVLLFFGFIRKYKGLDLLLEALRYCDENAVVLITGECYGDFSEYQRIIDKNKLSKRVICNIRYIPDSEVSEIFSVSDICVLPYRTATQSGIASIAKFYELPMVVTPVGELPNEVVSSQTGVVCKSLRVEDLADGINKCLGNLEKYSSQLKAEKSTHNWTNFASELSEFIRRLKN